MLANGEVFDLMKRKMRLNLVKEEALHSALPMLDQGAMPVAAKALWGHLHLMMEIAVPVLGMSTASEPDSG